MNVGFNTYSWKQKCSGSVTATLSTLLKMPSSIFRNSSLLCTVLLYFIFVNNIPGLSLFLFIYLFIPTVEVF